MEKRQQFSSYCHCISSLGHRRVPDSLLGPQLPVLRGRLSWGTLYFLHVSFRTVVACVGTDCLLKSDLTQLHALLVSMRFERMECQHRVWPDERRAELDCSFEVCDPLRASTVEKHASCDEY